MGHSRHVFDYEYQHLFFVRSADDAFRLLQEIAEKLKSQGNDHYKSKRYEEAIVSFTEAIAARPAESALLQSCYLNRAACYLELSEQAMTPRRRDLIYRSF